MPWPLSRARGAGTPLPPLASPWSLRPRRLHGVDPVRDVSSRSFGHGRFRPLHFQPECRWGWGEAAKNQHKQYRSKLPVNNVCRLETNMSIFLLLARLKEVVISLKGRFALGSFNLGVSTGEAFPGRRLWREGKEGESSSFKCDCPGHPGSVLPLGWGGSKGKSLRVGRAGRPPEARAPQWKAPGQGGGDKGDSGQREPGVPLSTGLETGWAGFT